MQADIAEETQSCGYFFYYLRGNQAVAAVETRQHCRGPFREVSYIHSRQLGDVVAVDIEMQGFAVQAVAFALWAYCAADELPAPFACLVAGVVVLLGLYEF